MQDVGTNLIDGHVMRRPAISRNRVQDVGTNLIDGHKQSIEEVLAIAVQDVGTNLIDGHRAFGPCSAFFALCKTSAPT